MPFFICHVCNGTYSIGELHICKIKKEEAADVIPLGKLIEEALKNNKEEDDDDREY